MRAIAGHRGDLARGGAHHSRMWIRSLMSAMKIFPEESTATALGVIIELGCGCRAAVTAVA